MAAPCARYRFGAAVAVIAGLVSPAAMAATPPAPPPAAPAEDALKTAFEALSEPDRRAVQEALIWVGAYTSAVSGNFGPRTRDAVNAYAKDAKQPPLSVLDPAGRDRLKAAAKAAQATVGFGPVRDKRAGMALSLPLKILTKVTTTETGTRYASGDTAVAVDTLSRAAGDGGLQAMFDRMSASSDGRTVTYKFSRPDFFVVTGETGEGKFYSRYALEPDAAGKPPAQRLIRGFSLSYLKGDAKRMDRITIAVAASFDPFPAPAPSVAAAPGKPTAPGVSANAGMTMQAVIVAPGLALTALAPQRCPAPKVGGVAATIKASDAGSGLALLAVPGLSGSGVTSAGDADAKQTYFALFKQSDIFDIAPATIGQASSGPIVSSALQASAGVPVIARSGALVGVVTSAARRAPVIGATVLASDYPLAASAVIERFLARAGVTLAPSTTPESATLAEVVKPWAPLIVTVACDVAPTGQ